MRPGISAGLLVIALASPLPASAAGFFLIDQSATFGGASFAGAESRADDPATLFFNPAGIARLPGIQVSLSGSLISLDANLKSATASRAAALGGGPVTGTTGGFGGTWAIPDLYATVQVAPDLHLGL